MRVEKLAICDASRISQLYKQEFENFYLLGTVYQSPKLPNYLKNLIKKDLESFFGIVSYGQLIGVIQYRKLNDCLHINNIVIDSLYQGKGLGKTLLSWVEEQAARKKLDISLDVDSLNHKALEWYRSFGFTFQRESRISVFKLTAQKQSAISLLDEKKHINFGFSNAYVEGFENIIFFWIEPNTFLFKSSKELNLYFLEALNESVNGFLVIDSNLLSNSVFPLAVYNKLVFRMRKNVN